MLISSGSATSVAYISDTQPIPRDKPDIAKVHALAGEYLGMKLIYLEAGSGARESVPDDMIGEVASYITRPLVVGGGIETPEEANAKVVAGSSFVVIGTKFEQERSPVLMAEFSDAIHIRESAEVKK
jgi:phosphoglycerol geranylgeranyltransferase